MTMPTCKSYETCEAPICPAEVASAKPRQKTNDMLWYPDEKVCPLRAHGQLQFVQMQRKIVRKNPSGLGYFTYEMLNRQYRVTASTEGIDPDTETTDTRKKWLAAHAGRTSPIKPVSDEQKTKGLEALKKYQHDKKRGRLVVSE